MYALYSFATSERPEAYVNALCYCVSHRRVTSFKVVVVEEKRTDGQQIRPSTLYANIVNLLTDLSEGRYAKGSRADTVSLGSASDSSFEVYRRALDVLNSSGDSAPMEIREVDLDRKLRSIIRTGTVLFDVTSLKNRLLIDVVAISISLHFNEIYTFDSVRKLTFDERDLFHKLRAQDFVFQNLTDSCAVSSSMTRIKRWSAGSKFLVILVVALLLIGITITWFLPGSSYEKGLVLASMIASIGSFVFLFSRYGR